MPKTRLNISIDDLLADFIKMYAQKNHTTASEVITQFILGSKRIVTIHSPPPQFWSGYNKVNKLGLLPQHFRGGEG